jgi:hypothetical protein
MLDAISILPNLHTQDLPSRLPTQSSTLYSNNITKFLLSIGEGGRFNVNLDDEVIRRSIITYQGETLWPAPSAGPPPTPVTAGPKPVSSPPFPHQLLTAIAGAEGGEGGCPSYTMAESRQLDCYHVWRNGDRARSRQIHRTCFHEPYHYTRTRGVDRVQGCMERCPGSSLPLDV